MTRPLTARSICCGVRGGSTEIVGTTSAVAPNDSSRAMVDPDCSLVRGTRTFQPNSGLVSNQDSCSRSATVVPTTASAGNSRVFMTLATSPRVVTRVAWRIVVPRSVRATGLSAERPAASSLPRAVPRSSGWPSSTTVTDSATEAAQSTCRSFAEITCTAGELLDVSGMPA